CLESVSQERRYVPRSRQFARCRATGKKFGSVPVRSLGVLAACEVRWPDVGYRVPRAAFRRRQHRWAEHGLSRALLVSSHTLVERRRCRPETEHGYPTEVG